jgi:hypothetical protein
MSGHRSGVSQTQIEILPSINIAEMSSFGLCNEKRKCPGPSHHPVHRHTAQEVSLGLLEQRQRPGVLLNEALLLLFNKLSQSVALYRTPADYTHDFLLSASLSRLAMMLPCAPTPSTTILIDRLL